MRETRELGDKITYAKLLDIEKGFGLMIPTRYEVDTDYLGLDTDLELKIYYKFSSTKRLNVFKNQKYGADNMTHRRLYEILVNQFNGGISFIDTYFYNNFETKFEGKINKLKKDFERALKLEKMAIEASMIYAKSGLPKKSSRGWKRLSSFDLWKKAETKARLDKISEEIRQDIIQCLATGKIQLMFTPKLDANGRNSNLERRAELGLDPVHAFYASGELIKHLFVYFKTEFV